MTRFAEMRKRLLFLLGALVVYRIGTFIPVPGIDAAKFARSSRRSRARCSACSTCSRAARCSASAFSR
jgi:preprotein translocase subunit SecY